MILGEPGSANLDQREPRPPLKYLALLVRASSLPGLFLLKAYPGPPILV